MVRNDLNRNVRVSTHSHVSYDATKAMFWTVLYLTTGLVTGISFILRYM